MHEPAYPGETHSLGDIARAAEVDVESERQRLLDAAADQPRGVHDGSHLMRVDGLDQRRQVAHVLAHHGIILVAELEAQEIGARLGIEKHHLFSALQSEAREGRTDQARPGNQGRHDNPP